MATLNSIARFDDPMYSTVFSEKNKIFRRTDRIHYIDKSFFYLTREGEVRGPFMNAVEAKSDLNVFIQVTEIERDFSSAELLKS